MLVVMRAVVPFVLVILRLVGPRVSACAVSWRAVVCGDVFEVLESQKTHFRNELTRQNDIEIQKRVTHSELDSERAQRHTRRARRWRGVGRDARPRERRRRRLLSRPVHAQPDFDSGKEEALQQAGCRTASLRRARTCELLTSSGQCHRGQQ